MVSSTDWTSVSPIIAEEFYVQAETTVRIGTNRYYGSLETISSTYNVSYDYASQGLDSSFAQNFGLLEGISIELTAEFEDVPASNVISPGIKTLSAEGATISMTIKDFRPDILEFLIQNGIVYDINSTEKFITFGGSCTTKSRPLELSVVNLSCGKPDSVDIAGGITGLLFTIYDGQFTSGLNWSDVVAQGLNNLEATYEATPWLTRALGNRIGNILFF